MAAALPAQHSAILAVAEMATELSEVEQCHAHAVKTGLFSASAFAAARLVSSAVAVSVSSSSSTMPHESPDLSYAYSILERTPHPNSFAWNSLIRGHVSSLNPELSVVLFVEMLGSPVLPDGFSVTFALKACSVLLAIKEAQQIHGRIIKSGFASDIFVLNTLLHAYAVTGQEQNALNLFDQMRERDVVTWNALISSYIKRGMMEQARKLFDEAPDRNIETWNFIISGYANIGSINEAQELFDKMPARDTVSWNAVITGCVLAGRFGDVIELFRRMQKKADVRPDGCTLVSVLCACAQLGALGQGEWVHLYMDRNGIEVEGFLCTALVDMYSKCGDIEKAMWVFQRCLNKDVSSWNSMLAGLSSHGRGHDALELFKEMSAGGVLPNEITYVNVLSACSHAGLVEGGEKLFSEMVHVHRIEPTAMHYGCLVDLLGRAGELRKASEIAGKLAMDVPEVWESLLSSSRSRGDVELAELAAKKLTTMSSPQGGSSYTQLSNLYASLERWSDVENTRALMRKKSVKKEPGCSTIEVDGVVHEFFAGEFSLALESHSCYTDQC